MKPTLHGVSERDRLLSVLLMVRDAFDREGWEDGPTLKEAGQAIDDELFNSSADPGMPHGKEVARLRALYRRRVG